MSLEEKRELVARLIDMLNRRDLEGLAEILDPQYEFNSLFVAVEGSWLSRSPSERSRGPRPASATSERSRSS
jgi:hypothetical protein